MHTFIFSSIDLDLTRSLRNDYMSSTVCPMSLVLFKVCCLWWIFLCLYSKLDFALCKWGNSRYEGMDELNLGHSVLPWVNTSLRFRVHVGSKAKTKVWLYSSKNANICKFQLVSCKAVLI